MDLKKMYTALVKLEGAIKSLNALCMTEYASELEDMYDIINNTYREAIEQANEIKREQDKGGQYDD